MKNSPDHPNCPNCHHSVVLTEQFEGEQVTLRWVHFLRAQDKECPCGTHGCDRTIRTMAENRYTDDYPELQAALKIMVTQGERKG